MKKIIYIILFLFSFEFIYSDINDKDFSELLQDYCFEGATSENKRFSFFVNDYCNVNEYMGEVGPNEYDKIAVGFKNEYVEIKKGDVLWWFIYDHKKNKIIYYEKDFGILGEYYFLLNDLLIFDLGTSHERQIIIFNLNEVKEPLEFMCFGGELFFSKDHKILAFYYLKYNGIEDVIGEETRCIKIIDLYGEEIANIVPTDNENGKLKIIEWEKNILYYEEEIDWETDNILYNSYEIK